MEDRELFVVNDPGNGILEFWSTLFLLKAHVFSVSAHILNILEKYKNQYKKIILMSMSRILFQKTKKWDSRDSNPRPSVQSNQSENV